MFESFDDLMSRLKATGYFIDPVMTRIVFLAAKLQKPLLLEGPAGSGKTLAAFLVSIDRLLRQAIDGCLPPTTQVVDK